MAPHKWVLQHLGIQGDRPEPLWFLGPFPELASGIHEEV
jgi:hypothetical protein